MIQPFLQNYEGIEFVSGNWDAVDYRKFSIDSRTIQPGELFLALRGESHDGHAYVAGALDKKAAAAVVEKNWYDSHRALFEKYDQPVAVVENTLDFLQQLGAWHRRQFPIPVIGLTGSNGKTTTREMIAAVLASRFRVFRSSGNKNNHIGLPLMLLQISPETEIAVIEMGTNHPGEIALLTELTEPNAGVVTNIGKGHIGFFGSLEAVYREKIALFDGIEKSDPVFINMEDRFLRNYPIDERIAVTVGYSKNYHTRGRIEFIDRFGRVKFRLNEEVSVQLRVPGTHQVTNALLAAAVGLIFGVELEDVKKALENFSSADKRMEIFEKNSIIVVNDAYNANPDSMRAAINYLVTIKNAVGKRILVLGDMLELGEFSEREHFQLGEYIAERPVSFIFLYGPETRYTREAIEKENKKNQQVFWYKTHREITAHLKKILAPRDILLVKGSRGMTMEKVLDKLWD